MIPTPEQCYQLMDEYRMLANIKDHSLLVARIAVYLAAGLRASGVGIPHKLVLAAALLHDIAKTPCLTSKEDHAQQGREICLAHGYEELAEIVGEHVVLSDPFTPRTVTTKEVVYYADKRVNHDQVVDLGERRAYIMHRYGQNDPAIHLKIIEHFERCQLIEEKIFRLLPCRPDELATLISADNAPLSGEEERERRVNA